MADGPQTKPAATGAAGLRRIGSAAPKSQRTEVIVLRFCAHACSLSPIAVGRSLP